MPGKSIITRSLRTILNFTGKQVKVSHRASWLDLDPSLRNPLHWRSPSVCSTWHWPFWESLSTNSHNKGSPKDPWARNYRISCQLNLQCAGKDSCKPLAETKAAFWEKELCRMERLGINKEPWNACPFHLAIETPSPGQEMGVYIATSLGGYFRLLALLT